MNYRKLLSVMAALSLCAVSVFAHGKKDVEEIDVENLNSWQETFDLEGKKKGKYNIMITANDLGGNTLIEGPHNIYVDPNSDLCIPGITNPYEGMRVVGNLNIVGTCVDDDGVKYVELVLDGDEEHPIRAVGQEFWSYYLDTTNLEEGPHTIKVTGFDINGLQGKTTKLTWQLDRRQPVTSVKERDMETDRPMGLLVSGNVHFQGLVEDGNGIRELKYSIDNGEHFRDLKIKVNDKKANATFDVVVNTKEFEDGPAVIWFRAVDNAGSVGLYSFLYHIDNTKPDVQIITPAKDDQKNGKFSIAGFAKDEVGVKELTWTFGAESGEIELIPGNPYWCLDFDTIGSKDKSRKFSIRAVDKADNVVEVSQNINLNQELDKPVVVISEPAVQELYMEDERLFVRGIATDDDGLESVKIVLDSNEPVVLNTKGVFFYDFGNAVDYETGKHKITVTGTDMFGVEGNPVSVEFLTLGKAPQYADPVIAWGKENTPFINGIEVHPESGSSFQVGVSSTTGIKNVKTEYWWGNNAPVESETAFKNVMNCTASFGIPADFPKGVVNFRITSTDVYDRENQFTGVLYITNTTTIKQAQPSIVFDDSTVDSEGRIINNSEFPASGYLIGDTAKSVEIVPETPFATAKLNGNQIQLIPGNVVGTSEKVVVKVTTAKDDVIESIPLTFVNDTEIPALSVSGYSSSDARDILNSNIVIEGSATCSTGMNKVRYRVLSATVDMAKGVIAKVNPVNVPSDFESVKPADDGAYRIEIPTADFATGFYLVEVVAESKGGNISSKAVAFRKIPDVEEDEKGKIPVPKAQVVSWFDGIDVYACGIYQGDLEEDFAVFPRSEMIEGTNPLTWTATVQDGRGVASKYNASKAPTLKANIALVNGETYMSGMPVVLDYGNDKNSPAGTVTVYIDTGAVVNSASYEIYGAEIAGGDVRQTGNAKLTKPAAGETRWTAEIPLKNLPVRVNKVKLNIKAGSLETSVEGSVNVVRSSDGVLAEDKERVFSMPSSDMFWNEAEKMYGMNPDSKFYYYANLPAPVTAELVGGAEGLQISTSGSLITMTPVKDGVYKDVKVKVTDVLGDVYESEAFDFTVDSSSPELKIVTPELYDWQATTVKLTGTAADTISVVSVEYSLDGGETWEPADLTPGDKDSRGVTYSKEISIADKEDGLIRIDVRAKDTVGNVSIERTSVYKDVTPPSAKVILPLSEDIVNGENLVVFEVSDNGFYSQTLYVAPPVEGTEKTRKEIERKPLISTFVGTKDCPIDDAMSFEFIDAAGNKTSLEAWNFLIDNQSDLPVSEIHLPEENQVITRDFTISGVIFDDDGDSTIYYKIDDGEFKRYPQMGSSFSIDVPISAMVDNEHKITVYAVDVNGVQGNETVRNFRVSLAEPKGVLSEPEMDKSVRELITLKGWANDKNGIAKVQVSLDNGNSYNDAILENVNGPDADWYYTVDSRAIPGGTQVVFLKITDNYDIQGLYSSLINIDNESPVLNLELPEDDSTTTGMLFFSGYSYDNVEISDMHVTIRNLNKNTEPYVQSFPIERVIGKVLDITSLDDGFYNIELTAVDAAGNTSNVSRNIHLDKNCPPAVVDILYPLNGEHKTGEFNIYGQAKAEGEIVLLNLFVDEKFIGETKLSDSGFFKFGITQDLIADGVHTYRVEAVLATGNKVSSREQTLTYAANGPWVTIDNFVYGDFATGRPYLKGRAGYTIDGDELLLSKTKEASPELKAEVAAKKVQKIELSLDNGKTFIPLSTGDKWMYRIENEDLPEGYHFLLIRATMLNGESAIERTIVQIDNTKPTIRLISPSMGGRYNQELLFSGLSGDDVKLENVKLTLRKGDKSSYEVPSFIQGLYLDFHFWGATLFDIGAGLTFFDDNVKLQFQWGQFTQAQRDAVSNMFQIGLTDMRYGGNVMGMKLLANISTIPFSYFFGHDWEWLSASFAVGANFSYFTQTNSGTPQFLSAVLGQIEFPRIKFNGIKMFSTVSMYTEGSLWFIPTDVASGSVDIQNIVPQISLGLRVNVF